MYKYLKIFLHILNSVYILVDGMVYYAILMHVFYQEWVRESALWTHTNLLLQGGTADIDKERESQQINSFLKPRNERQKRKGFLYDKKIFYIRVRY